MVPARIDLDWEMTSPLTRSRLRRPVAWRGPAIATVLPVLATGGEPETPRPGRRGRLWGVPRSASADTIVRSRRVLLVDDDPALRMLYRFNLEASGVDVVEAEDGESALALLERDLPDVVLLDVMMPGIDGWTVAERLARDDRLRALPVIFVTARASDEARARGLRLGAAGYLTKPFNPVSLADEIERILERARKGEQKEQ
jgi:CheY-like chemotaxis protein